MHLQLLTLFPCLLPAAAVLIRRSCNDFGGPIPKIESTNDTARPYVVGTNSFTDLSTAMQRSCDIQNNNCFNQVHGGNRTFTTGDCQKQYRKPVFPLRARPQESKLTHCQNLA